MARSGCRRDTPKRFETKFIIISIFQISGAVWKSIVETPVSISDKNRQAGTRELCLRTKLIRYVFILFLRRNQRPTPRDRERYV